MFSPSVNESSSHSVNKPPFSCENSLRSRNKFPPPRVNKSPSHHANKSPSLPESCGASRRGCPDSKLGVFYFKLRGDADVCCVFHILIISIFTLSARLATSRAPSRQTVVIFKKTWFFNFLKNKKKGANG